MDNPVLGSRINNLPNTVQRNVPKDFLAQSSLVSLSSSHEKGLMSEIFGGVWSIVTWPVGAAVVLWHWLMGTRAAEGAQREESLAGLKSLFNADEEFDSEMFKQVFATMNAGVQKSFKTILWIISDFEIEEAGKDWATRLLDKRTYDEDDQGVLKAAVDLQLALPRLRAYSAKAEYLAREMENEEESNTDIDEGLVSLRNATSRWPALADERAKRLYEIFAQRIELPERDANENRREIHQLRTLARVNTILVRNNYLAVADATAREELETMLRRLSQHENLLESHFVEEYRCLGGRAKTIFAEVVGYMIGHPEQGEKYLLGTLKIEHQTIVPEPMLLLVALKGIVEFDGGVVPEVVQEISYSPLDGR
jgi:hypothetical protein